MIMLEFDDTVKSFEEQPVKVPVIVNGKKVKPYVPDILITYFPASSGEVPRPVLGEVKLNSYLQKHEAKYAPKFAAASHYCEEQCWEWRIFTENEIRTPYLDNLKFLREYHNAMPDQALIDQVINYLHNMRDSVTVESLLHGLCKTENDKLYLVPTIWQLITAKRITVDLQLPLTMKSKLSLTKEA